MNELLKQIEESEELVKQATNLNKMTPLILRNQLAIMKFLTSRFASLNAWPIPIEIPKSHVEPLEEWPRSPESNSATPETIPLRPKTRTVEEGR